MVGAIRNPVEQIIDNIVNMKEQFNEQKYHITTIFSTWEPTNRTYSFCTVNYVNYYYDYDKNELVSKLRKHIDHLIFHETPDLKSMQSCRNKCPPVTLYSQKFVKEFIEMNLLEFDHVVSIRNDLKIGISNISQFLNQYTYTPVYHKGLYNDHFYIMPFTKYISLSLNDQHIISLSKESRDNEVLTNKIILPDKVIEEEDIIYYILDGTLKMSIINR
jgi:hypothetical protein